MVTQSQSGYDMETLTKQVAETIISSSMESLSGNRVRPALRAKQGARITYTLSVTVAEFLEMCAIPDSQNESERVNRDTSDAHMERIFRGLGRKLRPGQDAAKYVMFPITGVIPEDRATFRPLWEVAGQEAESGMLTLPRGVKVLVTDGQHRYEVFGRLIKQTPWFASQNLVLFVIEESSILQQRTDFADGAKVLPMNNSIQAWFDTGVPLNKATQQAVEYSQVIDDADIEKFKNAVGGRSNPKFFTYNNLRGYVGACLVRGTPQKTEELSEAFDRRLDNLERDSNGSQEALIDDIAKESAEFLDYAFQAILGAKIQKAKDNPAGTDFNVLRESTWLLRPAGLYTYALLVHDLKRLAESHSPGSEIPWVKAQLDKALALNWEMSSDTFKGTLMKGGKPSGSSTAISQAVAVLSMKLGFTELIQERTAKSILSAADTDEITLTPAEKALLEEAIPH